MRHSHEKKKKRGPDGILAEVSLVQRVLCCVKFERTTVLPMAVKTENFSPQEEPVRGAP